MDVRWAIALGIILVMSLLTSCQERLPTYTGSVQLIGDRGDGGIAQQMPTNEAVITEVASQPWAIGYTSLGAVQRARSRVKTVALQGSTQAPAVPPTPETIRDQSYRLARILHLYTASEPTGVLMDFIDYCLSARGQELVRKAGYLAFTQ